MNKDIELFITIFKETIPPFGLIFKFLGVVSIIFGFIYWMFSIAIYLAETINPWVGVGFFFIVVSFFLWTTYCVAEFVERKYFK